MGLRTVVIDPDENALAKSIADVFLCIAGDDFETTELVVKNYDIKGIVTAATDNPILMMSRIAEQLNFAFPSYTSCYTILNKGHFKELLKKLHLPFAKGEVISKDDCIDVDKYHLPVIIKPLRNSGSRGVIKCVNPEDIDKSIQESALHSNDGNLIIEEFIEGDEISIEAFIIEGKVQIVQITDKLVTAPPYNVEIGHSQPSRYHSLKGKIQNQLELIVNDTGLNNCVIHPEAKVVGDEIILIEIGPRLGGDFISSRLVPLSTKINLEDIAISIALKDSFKMDYKNNASLISYFNLPPGEIIKKELKEEHLKNLYPEVKYFEQEIGTGKEVNLITNSLNRYGYYILSGLKIDLLLSKKKEIDSFLKRELLN